MGTLMQKKAAKKTLESLRTKKRINKGEILKEAGYSKTVQTVPSEVFERDGFKEELLAEAGAQGLTEDFIKGALMEDIVGKPRRRIKELELGAAILKMTEKDSKGPTTNNFTQIVIHSSKNAQDVRHLPDA